VSDCVRCGHSLETHAAASPRPCAHLFGCATRCAGFIEKLDTPEQRAVRVVLEWQNAVPGAPRPPGRSLAELIAREIREAVEAALDVAVAGLNSQASGIDEDDSSGSRTW
jgi:hypothetical protein